MTLVEKFIAEVESWEGTPFVHEGGRKKIGTNCSQFVLNEVMNTLGVTNPEVTRFKQVNHIRLLRHDPNAIPKGLVTFCRKVTKDQIQPGDIALFSFAEIPAQIAVYKGNGVFIYSLKSMGVVVQALPSNLEKQIVSYWRPKCFEEGV